MSVMRSSLAPHIETLLLACFNAGFESRLDSQLRNALWAFVTASNKSKIAVKRKAITHSRPTLITQRLTAQYAFETAHRLIVLLLFCSVTYIAFGTKQWAGSCAKAISVCLYTCLSDSALILHYF